MRRVGIILPVLVLAGCASSGDWFRQDEPQPAPVANQEAAPRTGADQPAAPGSAPGSMTPAARAAAADTAGGAGGELLDCVTDSCKVNCSAKVPKQFRPKWCARFKEPN
jgi:hypothetical protein